MQTGKITKLERVRAWTELQHAAREKKTRPFYRAVDRKGHMLAGKYADSDAPTHKLALLYLNINIVLMLLYHFHNPLKGHGILNFNLLFQIPDPSTCYFCPIYILTMFINYTA